VICPFGLLHLPEPDKAISEAFRVLKPGGRYHDDPDISVGFFLFRHKMSAIGQ
jgi:ubiquinone/menaquinone biosynthesis C-methylase UbiE